MNGVDLAAKLAEFELALQQVDWHYAHSDDPKAFRKGKAAMDNLHETFNSLPKAEAKALWNKYTPGKNL